MLKSLKTTLTFVTLLLLALSIAQSVDAKGHSRQAVAQRDHANLNRFIRKRAPQANGGGGGGTTNAGGNSAGNSASASGAGSSSQTTSAPPSTSTSTSTSTTSSSSSSSSSSTTSNLLSSIISVSLSKNFGVKYLIGFRN